MNLKFKNGKHVTVGNIYVSPNNNEEEDEILCQLIDEVPVVKVTNHEFLLVGHFNFPYINWDIFHTDSTGSSPIYLDGVAKYCPAAPEQCTKDCSHRRSSRVTVVFSCLWRCQLDIVLYMLIQL